MSLPNTSAMVTDEEALQLHPFPEHPAVAQEEHFRRYYALLLVTVLTKYSRRKEANLLNTLTIVTDKEQLQLHLLPEHAVAAQNEHFRQHYALLLAAVLASQDSISESQTCLLRLLLEALKLGDIRAQLFEQARALTPEPLKEAARLIRQAGFSQHLLQDVLVLLRLEAPLSDESARLVGELAAFLGVNQEELAVRALDAVYILGLDKRQTEIKRNEAEKEENCDVETIIKRPMWFTEIWPHELSQPLTADALRAGLQGGVWLLDNDLEVNFPWQAKNAIFIFRNGATLDTLLKNGGITLTDCRLLDAVLNFEGTGNVGLKRCDWQGDYDLAKIRTVLHLKEVALTATDCQFSTRNARAISVKGNNLTLTGSRFTDCGHSKLDGGAVWHSDHKRQIRNCYFKNCLAARGGALSFNKLRDIQKCEFVTCQSLGLQDQQAGDVAVYAVESAGETVVSDCVFRETSLVIGDASYSGYITYVRSTQFYQANIYCHTKHFLNQIHIDCQFTSGRVIDINFK